MIRFTQVRKIDPLKLASTFSYQLSIIYLEYL